ncbi:n19m, NADH-ubiquinone oxidoreductase 9.5 kDa subunit [Mycoemilia scoparia]|uniref:N19m, NADH-ubiquinone oxidoreductase 9.5 kDa subunit n=1 Tax=Mycoemilia scoparia TaxID=417184 RepID=A0A9W8DVA9_9FUNG|nr:n19m, NADH-ubiquinone oxidoreductase 9.5 kDa subunit [Mycoemilia scoparia]
MAFMNTVWKRVYAYPFAAWGIALGSLGPLIVLTVPPLQRKLGYVKPERVPTSYPLPNRPRRPTPGFED